MPRRSSRRRLAVWMNGERVGTWTAGGRTIHEFEYSETWLASPRRRPISLSLPLRPSNEPYRGERVFAYFDNLLPDDSQVRRRLMSRFGAASDEPFDLLAEIGRDCVGAVQLLPENSEPADPRKIDGTPLTESEVELVLQQARGILPVDQDEDDFRISLAGTQEKTALLRRDGRWFKPLGSTPTTHILKLPIEASTPGGINLSSSVENEWLCAQIVASFGVEIARCEMARFGGQKALVVERFDRVMASDGSWLIRIPQEDFCQVKSVPQARKYESDGGPGIRDVMDTLGASSRALEDRADFMRTQFIFWLLCATDGHAKNFSIFIDGGGGFRLTPRYDVLSAYPFLGHGSDRLSPHRAKMAMGVFGANKHYRWREIRLEYFVHTARACGLSEGASLFEPVIARAEAVANDVAGRLPDDFPREVSEPILSGLVEAAKHAGAGTAPGPP